MTTLLPRAFHEDPIAYARAVLPESARAHIVNRVGVAPTALASEAASVPALPFDPARLRPDLFMIGSGSGTTAFFTLDSEASVVCEFPPSYLVGEVLATLSLLKPSGPITTRLPPGMSTPLARSGSGLTETSIERTLLETSALGAFVVDRSRRSMPFLCRASAKKQREAFALVRFGNDAASRWLSDRLEAPTTPVRVVIERGLVAFGLVSTRRWIPWLVFGERVPRGLAFAALERLVATLDDRSPKRTLRVGPLDRNE